MARTKGQLISPIGILTAIGANISGVVTASSFSGQLNSSGVSTVANLQSTNINAIGIVTATSFVGQLNSSGVSTITNLQSTNINVTGVSTITNLQSTNINVTGISTITNLQSTNINVTGISTLGILSTTQTRFLSVSEKTTRFPSATTATLVYNSGGGNVAICTNPAGNITLSVVGIPTDSSFDDNLITFSVFITQTGTARSCTAVTLNGLNATIHWGGGSLANAITGVTTTNGMDIYNFIGVNTVGSASTTANYYVLGVVNGGYA